jgi:hypothetical protein
MRRYAWYPYDYILQYTLHPPQTAVVEAGRCWLIVPAQVRQDVPSKTLWTCLPTPASFSSVHHLISGAIIFLPTTSLCVPASRTPFFTYIKPSQKSREPARSHALSRLGHPSLPEGLRRAVQGVQDSMLCCARERWWRAHRRQWYVRHNTPVHAHRTSTNMQLQ